MLTQPLRKGYYIWLKPVLLVSDFLKIENANGIFFKKSRVSSEYVYGEFRKTGVRKIGLKDFYSVCTNPRERGGNDFWFVKFWKIKNKT